MNSTPIAWSAATDAINAAQTILVVTHVNPDGDAIGSLMGITTALRERGKIVTAAVDGGVPQSFAFIPHSQTILAELTEGPWDVIISTDASDEVRSGLCGQFGRANSRLVVNLDHHSTNTLFGAIHLVQPEAASATEIVYTWLSQMGHPLSQDIATPLLVGLVTDTMGFRLPNVTPYTLHTAQTLIQAGANLAQIMQHTLDSMSLNELNLWRAVLPSVQLHGRVLVAQITQADLETAGLSEMTDAGLVGFLRNVEDVNVAIVFKQSAADRTDISMRAKPNYNIGALAVELGGGGHPQAAGAKIPGTLADVVARVLPLVRAIADQSITS
jgi:bifunctional oligoribonuclease and PAP phosphatase NrnA